MKIVATIAKVLTALAAIAGFVYLIATYGDKIVAWAKEMLGKIGCCDCGCECDGCECNCDGECTCDCECEEEVEETAEEPAAEEAEAVPAAEETDFEG